MINFLAQISDCDSHSPALLDFFLSSDASICSIVAFCPFGNSNHLVVSVSIDFLSSSQRDALFHRIAYDHSCAGSDGHCDHLRNVLWEDIFKACVRYFSLFLKENCISSLFQTKYIERKSNLQLFFLFSVL